MDEVKVWEKELNQKWFPNSSFSKNEYVSLNISGLVAELFSLPLFLFKNLIFFSIYQRHSGQLSEEYVLMWWEMRMKEEICRHFCSLMGRHITIQRVGKPRVQSLPFNSEVLWVPLRLPYFNSTSEKQEGTLYVCQDPSRSNFFSPPWALSAGSLHLTSWRNINMTVLQGKCLLPSKENISHILGIEDTSSEWLHDAYSLL